MSRKRLGWLLLAPALVALVWTYVIPTGTTIGNLTMRVDDFPYTEPDPPTDRLKLDNLDYTLHLSYSENLGRALLLAATPLFLALLVAPLLAFAAQAAGRGGRLLTRVLISVPLAGYAPVAHLLAWAFVATDREPSLYLTAAASSAGVVLAVAVTFYLAAFRETEEDVAHRRRWHRPAYVVGGVLALAVVAAAIQSFNAPFLVWAVTPVPPPDPENLLIGPASLLSGAVDAEPHNQPKVSLLVLLPVTTLGVLATRLLLRFRTRIEFAPRSRPGPARPDGWLALPLTLPVLMAVVVATGLPWVRTLGEDGGIGNLSAAEILVNTWLPPLLSAVVSVLVAAVGGFALGVLRPIGERSPRLLLLFAPWLFVGVGPLVFAHRDRAEGADQVGTWFGLVPPVWLSIPALVVFTLFFSGRSARTSPVRSALPLVGIAVGVHWVLGAQDLLWPAMVGDALATQLTAPTLAATTAALGQKVESVAGFDLILPLPVLLVLVAVVVTAQVGYLDRLAIRTGNGPDPV
ncbi:hypothetical protein [Cryptosporangium aurantiacum]|uniref:hypothetical protein n=1 Tax=Cryptosporangium aurantiacum TaxID=134849 RepID=UPI00116132FD|nr:hypothetical protein [Cryptosporangium aurantiacum]